MEGCHKSRGPNQGDPAAAEVGMVEDQFRAGRRRLSSFELCCNSGCHCANLYFYRYIDHRHRGRTVSALAWGSFRAVVLYVLTLIGFFVVGYIIDFLAGTFGARRNLASAMKVSAYAPTAAWLAGVFNILPALSFLSILGLLRPVSALHRHHHGNAAGGEQCVDLYDRCHRVRIHRLGCHSRHPGDAVRNGHDDVAAAQGSALRCRIGRPGAIACAAATMAFASIP